MIANLRGKGRTGSIENWKFLRGRHGRWVVNWQTKHKSKKGRMRGSGERLSKFANYSMTLFMDCP